MPGASLRCDAHGSVANVTLKSVREHKGRLLIALEQAPDATSAERYAGATLYAPREALDVGEGEYLDIDLVGCAVRAESGKPYGTVTSVEHYPANDMLIVDGRMLPMVAAFIKTIDVDAKTITVDVPPGLLEEDD